MQVASYISELLYRHECVVIPNFGALISRRVPAKHYQETHTLYPPAKGLSFNEQIQQNDGLLVNHIAGMEKIPYEQALQEVRNFVHSLQLSLENNQEAHIQKIGSLKRGEEGSLQFYPQDVVNYLPEAFGLTRQRIHAIDRVALVDDQTIPQPSSKPAIELKDTSTTPLQTVKSNTGTWVRAAATVAILLAGSYVGIHGYQVQQYEDAVAVEEMANEQLKVKIQEASFLIATPIPSVVMEVTPIVKNYHIIAGAFRDPLNADKKVSQLKAQGYDAQRIGVNRYGLHNVAYKSFVDRDDAINALYRIRKLGNDGAWLLSGSLKK